LKKLRPGRAGDTYKKEDDGGFADDGFYHDPADDDDVKDRPPSPRWGQELDETRAPSEEGSQGSYREGSLPSETAGAETVDRTMNFTHVKDLDATRRRPPSPPPDMTAKKAALQFDDSEDEFMRQVSQTSSGRKRRGSLSEGPEWMMPTIKPDPYKDIVQYKLYYGPDPFRFLSNEWLEGEAGKLTADEVDEEDHHYEQEPYRPTGVDGEPLPETEEEKEKRQANEKSVKEQEAEVLRMEELLNDQADGWKLWLRGRDFRSEFKVQPSKEEQKRQEFREQEKKAVRRPRTVNGKGWIRAPIDARAPKGEMTCWRADFVKEARYDADLLGLERPTMPAEAVRNLARKDWGIIDQFYWHVEAVDLDGNRELWSPTFVGYLWEYFQRSMAGDLVNLSEGQLEAKAQSERLKGLQPDGLSGGLFQRKPVVWPKPIWKPPYFKVPQEVFHIVEQPVLPPVPRRFQHNLVYKDGPLERSLQRRLQGSEAMDAMLGTSDRLQAAGRSILRSEKIDAALEERRAAAAARKAEADAAARAEQEEIERKEEAERLREEENRRREEEGLEPLLEKEESEKSSSESEKEEEPVVEEAPSRFRKKKLGKLEDLRKGKAKAKPKAKKKDDSSSDSDDGKAKAKAKGKAKAKKKNLKGFGPQKKGGMGGKPPMVMMIR